MDDHTQSSRHRNSDATPDEGYLCIPRDIIGELSRESDLLALLVFLAASARYQRQPGKAPKGARIERGQLVTSKGAIAGQFIGWNDSRAYRGLQKLRERNLIELTSNRHGTIVTICNYDRYQPRRGTARTEVEPKSDRERSTGEPETNRKRTPTKEELNNSSPPTPSAGNAERDAWEAVEVELGALGMGKARQAVCAARDGGMAPADAMQLIAEFKAKPGAWGLGALHGRLTGELEHWPPESADYRRQQERRIAEAQQTSLSVDIAGRLEQLAADKSRRLSLEAKYRSAFEQLGKDEQRELFSEAYPAAADLEWRRFCDAGELSAPQQFDVFAAMEAREARMEPCAIG